MKTFFSHLQQEKEISPLRDDISHLETQATFVIQQNDIMRKHLLVGHKTHCVPGKQLPIYCCLEFWFTDNMNLSTMPSPCR